MRTRNTCSTQTSGVLAAVSGGSIGSRASIGNGIRESGAFRFTQTQGVGRRRLLLVTLASYLLLLIAGSGLVGLAISQFYGADSQFGRCLYGQSEVSIPSQCSSSEWLSPVFVLASSLAVVRRTVAGITAAVVTFSIGTLLIYMELFQKSLVFMSSSVMTNFDSFKSHQSFLITYWIENGHGGGCPTSSVPHNFKFFMSRGTTPFGFNLCPRRATTLLSFCGW